MAVNRGESAGTVFYANTRLDGKGVSQGINKAITLYNSSINHHGHDQVAYAENWL